MRNPFKAFRMMRTELDAVREELDTLKKALAAQNIKVHPRLINDLDGSPKLVTERALEYTVAGLEDRVNWRMGELGKKLGLVFVKPYEVKIPAHWESEDA